MKKKIFLILGCVLSIVQITGAQKLVVDNQLAKRDINNKILDVHDGRVVQVGKKFFIYGTAYGNTNGYTDANFFQSYSSEDLKTWKPEGKLIQDPPKGIYYRPHVIFNKKTKKYVLWYNWYPALWQGRLGVATSDKPEGPFITVNTDVKVRHNSQGLGDLTLFVDDDGTGYLVYNSIDGHKVYIEKLADDYLSSTQQTSDMIAKDCEATVMFRRNGLYYLMTDRACCFCNFGTGSNVYVAKSPLGGYTIKNNINRYPGKLASSLIDGIRNGNVFDVLKKVGMGFESAQIDFAKPQVVDSIAIVLFKGNREGNCGDVNIPKVHPDYILPAFDLLIKVDTGWSKIADPRISEDTLAINIVLNLKFKGTQTRSVRIVPKENYAGNQIYISEIELYNKQTLLSTGKYEAAAFINSAETALPIIPGQQTFVMPINTLKGREYIWMVDLWGSAPDHDKGHDFQYWGRLEFGPNGEIMPLRWIDKLTIELK